MRIVFTGGSGKAGRHVIPYLLSKGHTVLNLDFIPFPDPENKYNVYTIKCDLANSGQVFNALSMLFHMDEYGLEEKPGKPDAVIHFGAYARNMLVPDNECFMGNVAGTYNVVEAACKLGIKKVVIASSETTYGVCFTQGSSSYPSFPIDETLDVNPEDPYACSKLCGERISRSFSRRFSTDIYCLRIGNVIEPHEYAQNFPAYLADPPSRYRNAWSYIDARDLGQICHLCVEKDGLGFQVFNATNDTITLRGIESTTAYLKSVAPETVFTREMGQDEAPMSNRKIKEVLGFKEDHDWKKYV